MECGRETSPSTHTFIPKIRCVQQIQKLASSLMILYACVIACITVIRYCACQCFFIAYYFPLSLSSLLCLRFSISSFVRGFDFFCALYSFEPLFLWERGKNFVACKTKFHLFFKQFKSIFQQKMTKNHSISK